MGKISQHNSHRRANKASNPPHADFSEIARRLGNSIEARLELFESIKARIEAGEPPSEQELRAIAVASRIGSEVVNDLAKGYKAGLFNGNGDGSQLTESDKKLAELIQMNRQAPEN